MGIRSAIPAALAVNRHLTESACPRWSNFTPPRRYIFAPTLTANPVGTNLVVNWLPTSHLRTRLLNSPNSVRVGISDPHGLFRFYEPSPLSQTSRLAVM